jgi:hypothetical protein
VERLGRALEGRIGRRTELVREAVVVEAEEINLGRGGDGWCCVGEGEASLEREGEGRECAVHETH